MSKTTKVLLGVLAAILLLVFMSYSWIKGINNRLVAMDEKVKADWAQVENQLQRRYDLIPNLVNTVKGYAKHEEEVLTKVTNARASVGSAQTVPQKMQANNQLSSALGRLMVVMENYPDLKANQNFLNLQAQLEGTENRISTERRRYNESVREYNTAVRQFPTVIFANMFGFEKHELFKAAESAQSAPEVNFN